MPQPKASKKERTPPRERRKPIKKQPTHKDLKPTNHEEDFEHTLRRLVAARDGLGKT